eukprot:scaffold10184_cov52-Cyclotella_meneghiniana.AAC.4
MAALSRPDGRTMTSSSRGSGEMTSSASGGMASDFFSLRRPNSNVPGANHNQEACGVGQSSLIAPSNQQQQSGVAMPSALRVSSQDVTAAAACAGSSTKDLNLATHKMKKTSSVTFSNTTKQGSIAMNMNLASVMCNSQGGAAAVTQDVSMNSRPRSSSVQIQEPQASSTAATNSKNQFPIYLNSLPSNDEQEANQATSTQRASGSKKGHVRTKSKSTNTLQYYYKPQIQTTAPRFLHRNITMREMLDEGDGKEGDLNVRLRNERWKEFRTSCNSATSLVSEDDEEQQQRDVDDDDNTMGHSGNNGTVVASSTGTATSSLLGYKRTLTPSSLTSIKDQANNRNTNKNHSQWVDCHTRGCVSAHDLAVFRRSASRMRMTVDGVSANTVIASSAATGNNAAAPMKPGETLGAPMLERLSLLEDGSSTTATADSTGPSRPTTAQEVTNSVDTSSPLAQMMASRTFQNRMMMPTTNNHTIQRRVHTVSAGLAYGSAGFTTDPNNTRLSRFDLLPRNKLSALSASSGGSGGGGYGKNEEW